MKLWERVIERRLRKETRVSKNQFGFMPGGSTTEAIHLLKILMKMYRERQRDLHMAFLDLEKAHNSVLHDVVLIAILVEGLNNRLESWREAQEGNGLRILQPNESFRYLGSVIHRPGRIDEDVVHRIRAVEALLVDDSRRSGKPKLRWEDRLKQDMKELLLSEDMTSDRNA
ncbi:retrovirus-related pol polyprotein LINE-1 [Tanacetum coccineum]